MNSWNVLFIVVLLFIAALAATAADFVTFPGALSETKSPNGSYVVKNVPDRSLFFLRNGQKSQRPLNLPSGGLYYGESSPRQNVYDREVNILWSPDSSEFVLNDWYGSDQADAYLYRVDALAHPIDIGARLQSSMTDKIDKQCIEHGVHCFIFVSRWVGPKVVEVKIAGDYTSNVNHKEQFRQFTLYYLWDLRTKKFQRIKRESSFEIEPFGSERPRRTKG